MEPRAALKKISDLLLLESFTSDAGDEDLSYVSDIAKVTVEGLEHPRRNCDVYKTPDEMHNAFLEVCMKYKYCDNSRDNPCPYCHPIVACEFVWAGAEYKEDDNGRSNDR